MGFQYKVSTEPGRLRVSIEGTFESSLIPEMVGKVLEACREHKPRRLLVDAHRVGGQLSTVDRFQLGVTVASEFMKDVAAGKIPYARIAFLSNEAIADPERFGEKVATNRGMNLMVCTDENEALAWLEEERMQA